ncbi:polysaccharide deacetylase family protein [candidate division KSB1 bacterium]
MPGNEKKIYLTFDDGPSPESTHQILKILNEFKIKATFFCVGEMISKYPDILREIKQGGHLVGNHTYNHLNGWNTRTSKYVQNVNHCSEYVDLKLFRPPYGKIKLSQINQLKKDYQIVMWTVLSGDFDQRITKEKCLENVTKYTKAGSIVVFHDSKKTIEKVKYVLRKFIKHFLEMEYEFAKLEHLDQL